MKPSPTKYCALNQIQLIDGNLSIFKGKREFSQQKYLLFIVYSQYFTKEIKQSCVENLIALLLDDQDNFVVYKRK